MTTGQDDAALLARVVEGDHDAFAALMRRHEDRVFAVCLRIMGNRAAALDATQETFLTLYRKANQYRATAAVGTWLYRIAVNTCYDLLRKERRRPSEAMPTLPRPGRPACRGSVHLGGAAAFGGGRPRHPEPDFRAVVVLSDIEGMSLPEVAEALDVPVGTVKSRLFRARRQLAGVLGNLSDGSEHQTGTEP